MSLFHKITHYNSFLRVCVALRAEKCTFNLAAYYGTRKNPLEKRKTYKIYENNEKTRVCVTVLGNGALGQPRCLGVFTNNKTFLFNCGEGTCRILREYEGDFHKIRYAFITQNKWINTSGLGDIHITHETYGIFKLNVIGPPGVEYFKPLITSGIKTAKIVKRETPVTDDVLEVNSICINSDEISYAKKSYKDVVFSYAIKLNEMPAELVPEKLVKHNVPIGPHFSKLRKGEDVILPGGRIIHAVDVIDFFKEEILLVVDCPSETFLSSFVNNEGFSPYQLPSDTASKCSTVFHFSPPHVVKTKIYQNWMLNFHPKTQHVILNASCSSLSSEVVYHMQSIQHHLHSDIFKLLPDSKGKNFNASSSVLYSPSMLQIMYRPEKQLIWSNVVNYNPENYIQDAEHFPQFKEELQKVKSTMSSNSNSLLSNGNQSYPKVLFLGTSSSTSSAYRNVSAILLNVDSNTTFLLDCGEGTFNQFVRYFGTEDVYLELQKISCIFISHLHTDHYMGLFLLLQKRIEAFKRAGCPYQPVALILPFTIQDIFKQFCETYDPIYNKVRIFSCKSLTGEKKRYTKLQKFLKDIEIETVPVKHCVDSYGIVLKRGEDWKIVYSGDTAPCQKLIDAGENCTLLIHEASIEDDCITEAMFRKHSTPSQVIDVAEKMNAKYTILTHFSKRYLAVPVFDNTNKRVGCAFDFMKVELNQLHLVPLFLPAMKCLFPEQLEKHSERTAYVVNFENSFMKNIKANT